MTDCLLTPEEVAEQLRYTGASPHHLNNRENEVF